jgi:hypothetical protein
MAKSGAFGRRSLFVRQRYELQSRPKPRNNAKRAALDRSAPPTARNVAAYGQVAWLQTATSGAAEHVCSAADPGAADWLAGRATVAVVLAASAAGAELDPAPRKAVAGVMPPTSRVSLASHKRPAPPRVHPTSARHRLDLGAGMAAFRQ